MSDGRLHYMDNLRALAMLLGVFFHVAIAYSAFTHQFWLTADSSQSVVINVFFHFVHLFRMPLFFLVAGFFACMLYEKRGLVAFLKNRLIRITVPLLVFLPIISVIVIMLVGWAVNHVENKSPLLAMIAALAGNPDAPQSPPSTMHLWFLYYLTVFYILTALVVRFVPAHPIRANPISLATSKPLLFILLAPLCLVPALVMAGVPYPAPEQLTPKLWACWFFGFFYVCGWIFYRHGSAVDLLRPYWRAMLAVSLALFAIFYYLLPDVLTLEEAMAQAMGTHVISTTQVVQSVFVAYMSFFMVMVLLVVGKDVLNRKNRAIKLISDSSYWIYIIHIPIIFAIQFVLMDVAWPLWLEFFVVSCGTFVLGLATYLLFVRWTPIGWLLNGRKNRVRSPASPEHPRP